MFIYVPSHYWDLFRTLFKNIILQMTFPSTSLGLRCIFSPLNLLKVGYVGQITLTIDLQQKSVCYTMTKIWMSHVDGVIRQLWGSHQTVIKRSLEINQTFISHLSVMDCPFVRQSAGKPMWRKFSNFCKYFSQSQN